MPNPILYLYRGEHTWMVSQVIPQDEDGWSSRSSATRVLCEVDVEAALRIVQAELPGYEIRVLNWYRPKREYSPPA
jgi:hypothetical protein